MLITSLLFAFVPGLLSALPADVGASALPVVDVEMAASAQDPDPEAEFRKQIQRAVQIGDYEQVGKVMKSDIERARNYVVETAVKMGANTNKETGELLNSLISGWKRGPGGDFASNMQRYYELLDSSTERQRAELEQRYDPIYTDYVTQARREPSDVRNRLLLGLADQLESIGDAFDAMDDKFFASEAYYSAAWGSDTYAVGDADADLARVSRAYTKCAALRDAIDLKDDRHRSALARAKELESIGYAGDLSEEEAANLTPGIELGTPRTLTGTFRAVEDLVSMPQPSYSADAAFMTWSTVYMSRVGTTGTFNSIGQSPILKRVGDSQVEVTGTDGTEQTITLTGKRTLIETTAGSNPIPWAFELQTGGPQNFFQGIPANLQPDENHLNTYVAPAAGMAYDLDGVELVVFDTNMDGVYGSWPITIGYSQIPEGRFQPEIDAIQIDGGKRLLPFSEYVQVDDAWYKLEPQADGRNLVVTPATIQTGQLTMKVKGVKPSFVVLRGRDKAENVFVDLTSSKKVDVPIGQYQVYYGTVRDGNRADDLKKVLMLPTKATPILSVRAGETTDVLLGSPFAFQFEAEADDGETFVAGRPITVQGVAGEIYTRFWNTRPMPEVSVRAAGTKKGTKGKKMQLVFDDFSLADVGYDKAWFPLDVTITHRWGGEPVEVQLIQKKSELFGKIESEWTPAN